MAQALAKVSDRKGALALPEGISDEESRAEALAGVALAVAQVTYAGDTQVGRWVQEAFGRARVRGRDEVLNRITAFLPVLAKLGVISATWERLQAVESL